MHEHLMSFRSDHESSDFAILPEKKNGMVERIMIIYLNNLVQ